MMEPLPRPHKHVYRVHLDSIGLQCIICGERAGALRRAIWGLLGI